MPDYDPLSQRIQDGIVAERDRLRKENRALKEENRRLKVGAANLLRFNQQLSERNAELAAHARRWVQTDDAGLMFDPNPAPSA